MFGFGFGNSAKNEIENEYREYIAEYLYGYPIPDEEMEKHIKQRIERTEA
jgi:hypothetical protein